MTKKKYYFYSRKREENPKLKDNLRYSFKLFNYYHASFRIFAKSLIIIFLFILTLPFVSSASLFDLESNIGNTISADILNIDFTAKSEEFTPSSSLLPGETATQSALITNSSDSNIKYLQKVDNLTDPDLLCPQLILKVWYQWYEGGVLYKSLKYNGDLSTFDYNSLGTDLDMIFPNAKIYEVNPEYSENQHWYSYEVEIPNNLNPSFGNKTCSFDLVAKAWQSELDSTQGFYDEEILNFSISTGSWANVSGMKFNDLDGDGVKDEGEPGLVDWTIYASKEFEQFDIASTGEVYVTQTLDSGKTYLIRARGTFTAGDNITADAKYSIKPPDSTDWTDSVKNYESYGPELLDLQINNNSLDWGNYSDDHEYWLVYEGQGQPLSMSIYDIYPSNNVGNIEVTIFEPQLSDVTDADGNYEIDFSSLEGEVIIAEEVKDGWTQTFPAKGVYTLATNQSYENMDFGNQQVEEEPDLTKIVINEVYQDSDNSQEWVELYNAGTTDVNLFRWSIKDGADIGVDTLPNVNLPAGEFAVIITDSANQSLIDQINNNNAIVIQLTNTTIGAGLNISGDSLQLRDPELNVVDELSWGDNTSVFTMANIITDHSIDRTIAGLDTDSASDWKDNDTLNPGTNPHSHIQVNINQEDNNLIIGFTNAHGFDQLKYSVVYDHLYNGQTIQEAITGEKTKSIDQEILVLSPIYLGTCSTNGLVCTPHIGVDEIEINLDYLENSSSLGTSQIIYNWQP